MCPEGWLRHYLRVTSTLLMGLLIATVGTGLEPYSLLGSQPVWAATYDSPQR